MSEIPGHLKYVRTHEWVRDEGDGKVYIGITEHAQEQLGDVVYVELPEVGRAVSAGEEVAVVESVKTASDIYAPVSGEVVAVNEALADNPEWLNSGPYTDGWMMCIALSDAHELDGLLDSAGYAQAVAKDG
ncbi:MAG: glycine cleavage system protein GcvH [Gammaproteobacteria bacterium]|nr:glycine cleavage system protein GcvH [Gammaproteobacteria bacterium]